jgi:hypothetical protein
VVDTTVSGSGSAQTTGTRGSGSGGVDTPVDCSAIPCLGIGDIAWTDYVVVAEGIIDDGINPCHCDELNGIWDLSFTGTEWDSSACHALPSGCRCAVPTGPTWKLLCVLGVWQVLDYLSGIVYVAGTFTPYTGGTFTKTGTAMFCTNLPRTLTLSPAGSPIICE